MLVQIPGLPPSEKPKKKRFASFFLVGLETKKKRYPEVSFFWYLGEIDLRSGLANENVNGENRNKNAYGSTKKKTTYSRRVSGRPTSRTWRARNSPSQNLGL